MHRNILVLLPSAFLLVQIVAAQPTTTAMEQTVFERETNELIKQEWVKNILSMGSAYQAFFTKLVKELSANANQTATMQIDCLNKCLVDMNNYDFNKPHVFGKEFKEQIKNIYKGTTTCVDKTDRHSLENLALEKIFKFQEEIKKRLQDHFGVMSDEEGEKEKDLYDIYKSYNNDTGVTGEDALKDYLDILLKQDN